MKDYFERLNAKFDQLTDEDFDKLLLELGLGDSLNENNVEAEKFSKKYNDSFDIKVDMKRTRTIRFVIQDKELTNYTERKNVA